MKQLPRVTYPDPSRWLVLLAFCVNSSSNGLMSMNFASNEGASCILFGVDQRAMVWQYNILYFGVLVGALPAMKYLVVANYWTTAASVAANIAAAWLRYAASTADSTGAAYNLGMVSSFVLGLAGAVIISSFTMVAADFFPEHERAFAVSVAVQSNYFFWGLSTLATPYAVTAGAGSGRQEVAVQFQQLFLIQAIALSLATLGSFLAFYRQPPQIAKLTDDGPLLNSDSGPHRSSRLDKASLAESPWRSIELLLQNRQYVFEALCYGMLMAVSYTAAYLAPVVFPELGFSARATGWITVTFIFAGAVTGLVFGHLCNSPAWALRYRNRALKLVFVLVVVMLVALLAVTKLARPGFSRTGLYVLLLLLMMFAGVGSLSFVGPAMQKCVEMTHPVAESYSGGILQLLIQVWSALLPAIDPSSFVACTVCVVILTALYLPFAEDTRPWGADGSTVGFDEIGSGINGSRGRAGSGTGQHGGRYVPPPLPLPKGDATAAHEKL